MTTARIDKETVQKVAHLARLSLNDADSEKYSQDITAVLNWFAMLDDVDVEGISPSNHCENFATPQREDEITDGDKVDQVLANAVDSKFNMFSVPKVIE